MASNAKAFGELGKLIAAAGRVANGDLARSIVKATAAESLALAKEATAAGRNPMGRAWKKTKSGRAPLANVTGALQLVVTATGFKINAPSKPWLGFHQKGTKSKKTGKRVLPKRNMLPLKAVPPKWRDRIVARLQAEWSKAWPTS